MLIRSQHDDNRPEVASVASAAPISAPSGRHLIVARQDVGADADDPSRCVVRLQMFNRDGSAWGPEITVDAAGADPLHPAIAALAEGRFALAWQEAPDAGPPAQLALRVQVFNPDGSPWKPALPGPVEIAKTDGVEQG